MRMRMGDAGELAMFLAIGSWSRSGDSWRSGWSSRSGY
jgi:hypothetical protein